MFRLMSAITGPSYRHRAKQDLPRDFWEVRRTDATVGRGQLFAFQVFFQGNEDFICALDGYNHMSWKGLGKRVRIEITTSAASSESMDMRKRFVGYVKNDRGEEIADPLLNVSSLEVAGDEPRGMWLSGKIPEAGNARGLTITIGFWLQDRFSPESRIGELQIRFRIREFVFKSLKDDCFFLDLWQHPCNWARTYEVPLWSEQHWEVIDHQMELLGAMGQKAITCTVSDFPWIGQECFLVTDYPSNLFEYNIVQLAKSRAGELFCNFTLFDRWVETAMDKGISEELDLYGLVGVWDSNFSDRSFGNPFCDYDDAIRVRYFDEKTGQNRYMSAKKDLALYVRQLVAHLKMKGWWEKARICVDEPRQGGRLPAWMEFLREIESGFRFKMTASKSEPLAECAKYVTDWALELPAFVRAQKEVRAIRAQGGRGKFTWYVSCVPEKPNSTLNSPLIENRIIPWLNFHFDLDGFLRWALAIWPQDPWNRPRFVYPGTRSWEPGEMFLIYPGKDGRPVSSLRLENLRLGIQEHQLLKATRDLGGSAASGLEQRLASLLGEKAAMQATESEVSIPYSLHPEHYDGLVCWCLAQMEAGRGA